MGDGAITGWIAERPGPFSARTVDGVWRLAFENFMDGPCGRIDGRLDFMMACSAAGVDVRKTGCGGYVLARVN